MPTTNCAVPLPPDGPEMAATPALPAPRQLSPPIVRCVLAYAQEVAAQHRPQQALDEVLNSIDFLTLYRNASLTEAPDADVYGELALRSEELRAEGRSCFRHTESSAEGFAHDIAAHARAVVAFHANHRQSPLFRELSQLFAGTSGERTLQPIEEKLVRLAAPSHIATRTKGSSKLKPQRYEAQLGALWVAAWHAARRPDFDSILLDTSQRIETLRQWEVAGRVVNALCPTTRLAGGLHTMLGGKEVLLPPERSSREISSKKWTKLASYLQREGGDVSFVRQAVEKLLQREVVIYSARERNARNLATQRDLESMLAWFDGRYTQAQESQNQAQRMQEVGSLYTSVLAHRLADWASLHAAEYHRTGDTEELQDFQSRWRNALSHIVKLHDSPLAHEFLEDASWRRQLYQGDRDDAPWKAARHQVGEDIRRVIEHLPVSESQLALAREVAVFLRRCDHDRLSPRLWGAVLRPQVIRRTTRLARTIHE